MGSVAPTQQLETDARAQSELTRSVEDHYYDEIDAIYGDNDEFGFKAVENPVSVHDLHATMLHQLGYDHKRLTYRFAGRDFRLTDVHGEVIREILA